MIYALVFQLQESNSYKSLSGKILVNNTGDIVEVLLNRTSQAVDIFINKIFNTTYRPSTNIDIEGRNFVLYNDSGHLILAFPSGFSLQVILLTLSVPNWL